MKLTFNVTNQVIERIDDNIVVSDSVNYLELYFAFTDDWVNASKLISFKNCQTVYTVPLDSNDKVVVPFEVIKAPSFAFSIVGNKDDVRITTNTMKVNVKASGFVNGVSPTPSSKDIWQGLFGGTTGQMLAKKSDENYDFEWKDGGGTGDVPSTRKVGNVSLEEDTEKLDNYQKEIITTFEDGIKAGLKYVIPEVVTEEVQRAVMTATGRDNYYMPWYNVTRLWQWYYEGTNYNFLAFNIGEDTYYYNYVEGQWHKNGYEPETVVEYDKELFTLELTDIADVHNRVLFKLVFLNEDETPITVIENTSTVAIKDVHNYHYNVEHHNKMQINLDWDLIVDVIEHNTEGPITGQIYDDYNIDNNNYISIYVYTDSTPEGYEGTNYYLEVYMYDGYKSYTYRNWRFGKPSSSEYSVSYAADKWYLVSGGYNNELDEFEMIVHDIHSNARVFIEEAQQIIYQCFSADEATNFTLGQAISNVEVKTDSNSEYIERAKRIPLADQVYEGNYYDGQLQGQTMAEKVRAIKSWTYDEIAATGIFFEPPYWRGIQELDLDTENINVAYDDDNAGIALSITLHDNDEPEVYAIAIDKANRTFWVCYFADHTDPDSGSTAYANEWYRQITPSGGGLWPGYTYEKEMPNVKLTEEGIQWWELFDCIAELGENQQITVDDKMNEDLENKTYKSEHSKEEGTEYQLRKIIDIEAIPPVQLGFTNLYNDADMTDPSYIKEISIVRQTGRGLMIFVYVGHGQYDIVEPIIYNFSNESWTSPELPPLQYNPDAVIYDYIPEADEVLEAIVDFTTRTSLKEKLEKLGTGMYLADMDNMIVIDGSEDLYGLLKNYIVLNNDELNYHKELRIGDIIIASNAGIVSDYTIIKGDVLTVIQLENEDYPGYVIVKRMREFSLANQRIFVVPNLTISNTTLGGIFDIGSSQEPVMTDNIKMGDFTIFYNSSNPSTMVIAQYSNRVGNNLSFYTRAIIPMIEANPTLAWNDAALTSLGINGTNYKIESPYKLFTSATDASAITGTDYYSLGLSHLSGTPSINDYVAYSNNGAITTLYQIIEVQSVDVTMKKIGGFGGGGKQLYQHNINIQLWNTDYGWIGLQIINDNNTPFTYSSLKQWLSNSGFSRVGHVSAMRDKGYPVVGYESDGSKKPIYNIYLDTNDSNYIFYVAQGSYGSFASEDATNFNDIIIAL